jgi:hypothetical protein
MTTSLRRQGVPMPVIEPSTDFPTIEDEEPCPQPMPWGLIGLVAVASLVIGAVGGFVVGLLVG